MDQSTIRAIGNTLLSFKFPQAKSFGEAFAQRRYKKKLELPDDSKAKLRREAAWDSWISHDSELEIHFPLPGNWYRARLLIHEALTGFALGPVSFTTGSEFSSIDSGSVQSKLEDSEWECTPENFELWLETAYAHKAIKRAVKRRFKAVAVSLKMDVAQVESSWYKQCQHNADKLRHSVGKTIFRRKLLYVTKVIVGNRFSTVKKNNDVDRPICLEGFCNMLVQRRIGLGLRNSIKSYWGVHLTFAQNIHRALISQVDKFSTEDMKNASDGILTQLVKFLLPKKVFDLIDASRSPMTLGLDDQYHVVNKVSSMGNGFTFELMSLILLALCKTYAQASFVYGDDIILPIEHSESLRSDLIRGGFTINTEKSFNSGPFRESCGANFHKDEGYIESFDFKYPLNPVDVLICYNKVKALASRYDSFIPLLRNLRRSLPQSSQGSSYTNFGDAFSQSWVQSGCVTSVTVPESIHSRVLMRLRELHLFGMPTYFIGYALRSRDRTRMKHHLKSRQDWAKYEMYLSASRRTSDVLLSEGKCVTTLFIEISGRVMRVRPLIENLL